MDSIITSLNTISNVLRPIGVGLHLFVDIAEIITEEDVSAMQVTGIVSRCASLALSIFSTVGTSMKLPPKTLFAIKGVELGARVIDIPIQLIKDNQKIGEAAWTLDGFLQMIAQGKLSPFLGCLNAAVEMGIYREKCLLEKLKKDPEALRPLYRSTPDSTEEEKMSLHDYRKINAEECEKNIALFQKIQAGLNTVEVVSKSSEIVARLALFMRRQLLEKANHLKEENQNFDCAINPIKINLDEQFNLVQSLKAIPTEFHDDKIFSRYTCDIDYEPIRYIVQDPTANGENPVFYEREVIKNWLTINPISPHTRMPLRYEELIIRSDLQSLIDKRLAYYARASKEVFMQLLTKKSLTQSVGGA